MNSKHWKCVCDLDTALVYSRRFLRLWIVWHLALFAVILYSFGVFNIVLSCLLFIPIIQFNLYQALYRMNKQYLYDIRVTPQIGELQTPLLQSSSHKKQGYFRKLLSVVLVYIRTHPYRFTLEVVLVGVLSYMMEHVTGGICLFKHGRLNIQDITQ
jgi:hypothetical protein